MVVLGDGGPRCNADGTSARVATRRCGRRWSTPPPGTCPTGRERVTPHVLRHFCASQLYHHGMDLIAIQETLGHAWIATTMGYVHVHPAHIEDA